MAGLLSWARIKWLVTATTTTVGPATYHFQKWKALWRSKPAWINFQVFGDTLVE